MAAKLSFVEAQGKALRFWSANRESIAERVTFLVADKYGSRYVSFARDVDDYTIDPAV